MSGPSVVVDRAPDGWTHIGGPGMHLLIGLDEDDERTIAASDAADGGDIDDVVEVLTAGGMRKAHHFVGVHWQPQTRIVAFGPVSAVVTLADGTEHDVRATSSKVWTNLELPEHPERVVLRVLDESERSQPVPTQALAGGAAGSDAAQQVSGGVADAAPVAGQSDAVPSTDQPGAADHAHQTDRADDADRAEQGDQPADAVVGTASSGSSTERDTSSSSEAPAVSSVDSFDDPSADSAAEPSKGATADGADTRPAGAGIPTFGDVTRSTGAAAGPGASGADEPGASGDPAGSNDSGRSPWDRSWARRDTPPAQPAAATTPSQPVSAPEPLQTVPAAQPSPAAPAAAAAPALRAWTSAAPPAPVRATPKTTPKTTPPSPPTSGPSAGEPVTTSPAPQPEAPQPSAASPQPVAAPPVQQQMPEPAPSEQVPASPAPAAPPVAAPPVQQQVPEPAPSGPAPSSAAAAPVASDLPAAEPRDVDSTWAARPLLEHDAAPTAAPAQVPPAPAASVAAAPSAPPGAGAGPSDDETAAPLPSYDYLFGHTTTADEHRKALAQLTQPDDEDSAHDDEHLSVPSVSDVPDVPVTNAAPAPEVPERPLPSVPLLPETSEGSLISSVPWASPAPAAAPRPEVEPEVPTFSGRHTPPPAPSLLPPMNTPPPGTRAPEATPLISMGPPPASPAPTDQAPQAPAAPSAPAQPAAYAPSAQPTAEPSFDVPISLPAAPPTPPAPVSPVPVATPTTPAAGALVADDDDETELTVDRSALLEARNAAQNQTFSGPSVLAVLCSAGHPTPPHGDRCRVCGSSIPPQEPFTMPRPPLGVLRLSTGDVVTLDRSVLLGRAPRLGDGLAAHDRPHVVKVPSPERDISRNHVEVILEGWHVLIRDLGTTNGTTVTLPGESPMRLRANDQQVLEAGSRVSMADEVSFTFEAAL